MQKTVYSVAFNQLGGLLLDGKAGVGLTDLEVATFVRNLEGYNYTITPELAKALKETERQTVLVAVKGIMDVLEAQLGDKGYKTLYKGFPESVINLTDDEFYFNAVVYYLFGIEPDGNKEDWVVKHEPVVSKIRELVPLNLVSHKDLKVLLLNYLTSNVTLSDGDRSNIKVLFDTYTNRELTNLVKDIVIPIKETMVFATIELGKRGILLGQYKTATDVLRLIAEMSDAELSNKHIQFKKFKRSELKIIMSLLEGVNYLLDDMNTYAKPWKRFIKLYGSNINWDKYPKSKYAKDALFGVHKFETKKGKLDRLYNEFLKNKLVDMVQLNELVEEFKTRPGEFARQLVSILSIVGDEYAEFVINRFLSVADGVNTRVLYQLLDRVTNINNDVSRFISVNGSKVLLEETHELSDSVVELVKGKINDELGNRYASRDFLGKVYVDESYKKLALTTSQKGKNESLRPMTQGSRVAFSKDADVLRCFISWKNMDDTYGGRVDIDLNTSLYSDDFSAVGLVSYHSRYKGIDFSGDITDAPNGAVEYIDVKGIPNLINEGIRYIVMGVVDFTGHGFDKVGTVQAGVMELTNDEATKGKNHYTTAITKGFDIRTSKVNTNTIIIDLVEGEYVWVDEGLQSYRISVLNHNVLNNRGGVNELVKYMVNKNNVSLYDVLVLNAVNRGVLVDNPEEADIAFMEVSDSSPLPLADILANYI